jgi:hypothetical protein
VAGARTIPTKRQAIAILERGDRDVHALIDPLTVAQRTHPGIGGGEWSPVDLLAHLAGWERYGVEALDAWSDGRRAPIDLALGERGVVGVNADTLATAAALQPATVVRDARRTHAALVEAIGAVSTEEWERAPLGRGRPLGLRLGAILGGPAGPFRHVDAHLRDLRAFVGTLAVS